jgi:hypothetical protein
MSPEVSDYIIGNDRTPIDGLVPVKNPPVGSEEFGALLGHKISADDKDILQIYFSILQEGPVILEILDRSGQVIRPLLNGFKLKGSHTLDIHLKKFQLHPGYYQYRLKTGGKVYQRDLVIL